MHDYDFDSEPRAESVAIHSGGGNMIFVSDTGQTVLTIERDGRITLNPAIEQDVAVAAVFKIVSILLQGKF